MPLKRLRPQDQAPERPTSPKQVKLLYVEDEDLNWDITVLHLSERYDIERARDAQQAFDKLKKTHFHAILMDIQLSNSDLDGIEITRALRGKLNSVPGYARGVVLPNIPIIFMTAYAARYSVQDLVAVGGDDVVNKPVDFTELGVSLSRALAKNVR